MKAIAIAKKNSGGFLIWADRNGHYLEIRNCFDCFTIKVIVGKVTGFTDVIAKLTDIYSFIS